jgi:hypothetical protein
MLKVYVDGLFKPIFESIDGLLIFPALCSFFELILQFSVGILKLCIFTQQRCIELIIDFVKFVNLLFKFFILGFVVCELIL